jgi:hypothetical protein
MGESEQRWFCRSAGMNVCESVAEAVHCNTDKRIVSLTLSIDTISIMNKIVCLHNCYSSPTLSLLAILTLPPCNH